MDDQELKNLLVANQQTMAEVREYLASIKRQMLWTQVFSIIKILLIVIPLLVSVYYLQPLLQSALSSYGSVMQNVGDVKSNLQQGQSADPGTTSASESLQETLKRLNIGK